MPVFSGLQTARRAALPPSIRRSMEAMFILTLWRSWELDSIQKCVASQPTHTSCDASRIGKKVAGHAIFPQGTWKHDVKKEKELASGSPEMDSSQVSHPPCQAQFCKLFNPNYLS